MNTSEVWAKCRQCGTELKQSDQNCPKCGSTQKVHEVKCTDTVVVGDVISKVRQKRKGFRKFMVEMITRWRPSGDPKLKNGIHEDRIIDKEKKEYHQVCRDAKTGKITHEEHEPLSHHNN